MPSKPAWSASDEERYEEEQKRLDAIHRKCREDARDIYGITDRRSETQPALMLVAQKVIEGAEQPDFGLLRYLDPPTWQYLDGYMLLCKFIKDHAKPFYERLEQEGKRKSEAKTLYKTYRTTYYELKDSVYDFKSRKTLRMDFLETCGDVETVLEWERTDNPE